MAETFLDSSELVLNMGPQHPSTHGVLRIVLELDGETILKAVPDIGFLHTGIEKECEVKTWQQVVKPGHCTWQVFMQPVHGSQTHWFATGPGC